MAHQVRKERDVVELREKVLGEAVAEGVRIDHFGVDAVALREHLQLAGDATRRDARAEAVAEEVAACAAGLHEPLVRLRLEPFRDVETAELSALAVEVEIARFHVFHLDLQEFRDAGARGAEIAHHEIPVETLLRLQLPAEEAVIRVADDVLQKGLLLDLDELHLQVRLLDEVEVAVQGLKTQIHGLGLVVLHQPSLVGQQVLLVYFPILAIEEFHRLAVRGYRVVRQVGQLQRMSELFCHFPSVSFVVQGTTPHINRIRKIADLRRRGGDGLSGRDLCANR